MRLLFIDRYFSPTLMTTPELHLHTLFVLSGEGRLSSTREPGATKGPLFALIRGPNSCAWAVRTDVSERLAAELDAVAREEPPASNLRSLPVHVNRYESLLADRAARPEFGPAFAFPDALPQDAEVVTIDDERPLTHHFTGWVPGEIAMGRAPVLGILVDGLPVSVCFCARRSDAAAEAGVETAPAFRGRGLAPRVTAVWALSIRQSGRIPLYSTSWTNGASLAVARKLGLVAYACNWSLWD